MAGLHTGATTTLSTSLFFTTKTSKPYLHSNLHFPSPILRNYTPFPLRLTSLHSSAFKIHSLQSDVVSEESDALEEVKPVDIIQKRKLYVVNLPPFVSGPFVTKIFRQCGVVQEVEIIKEKDGRSRGYAFVTMASFAQAQAVIDKFHNKTVAGRTVRVQYAKQFKKPAPPRNVNNPPVSETRYKLYVSNLFFKVRSTHLREFFAAVSNPVSTRVVFDGPLGRSVGYGFVSYATMEEAEAALTALNGQELMGRPICIQFSEKNSEKQPGDKEEDVDGEQPNAASNSKTDISSFLLDRNILLTDVAD